MKSFLMRALSALRSWWGARAAPSPEPFMMPAQVWRLPAQPSAPAIPSPRSVPGREVGR